MISSGVEYIEDEPIVTTSLMVLLSLSFYICSRAANIWRQRKNPIKIELAANHKDHLLLSVFYLAPMILSLVFIFYSFFDRVYSDIFSWWFFSPISLMITAGYTYFFYRSVFLQNMEVESDISFINQLQNTYSERIKAYFIALMLTTAFLVTFYAGNFVDFKGLIGIAVLDITILYLISLRILFALIFWLFSFTPTLGETISAYKTLVLNIKQKGKQPFKNTLNRIQLVSSLFLCLLFLLVFINFKWTNRGYKKVIELELEAVKGDIERMPVSTYIAKWLDDKSREKENIYLVAGQGGGSRAGFWTGSALLTLDTITNHEFRNNCLAISTVSGSSLGAGIYLNNKSKLEVDDLSGFYNKDFISISLIDLLFIDPWQRILGAKAKYLFWLKNEKNRNEKLIKQEQQYLDEKKLESLWYYENFDIVNKTTDVSYKNGPLFIPNTYDIKNKVKSVISPVDFNENFIHNDLLDSLLTRKNVAPKTISNGQAINLSQMFPFFSQSASIDSTFQFFDGGVYDNSGLSTIRDIYSILSPLRDKYAKERKIFVVYLKNGIETKNEISYSNIGAVSKASMGSIFSAATKRQFKKLDAALNSNGDTLITDFKNERVHVNLNNCYWQ